MRSKFEAACPTALTLACLRFAGDVAASVARLATDPGLAHPWPGGFRTRWTTNGISSGHRIPDSFPTSRAWSHRIRYPRRHEGDGKAPRTVRVYSSGLLQSRGRLHHHGLMGAFTFQALLANGVTVSVPLPPTSSAGSGPGPDEPPQ